MADRHHPSIDDGPEFDADSIHLPDEVGDDMASSRASRPSRPGREGPNLVLLIVGAVVLGVAGGAGVFFLTERAPSDASARPEVAQPEAPVAAPAAPSTPPAVPPPTGDATKAPSPPPKPAKPAAVAAAPSPDRAALKPAPDPSPATPRAEVKPKADPPKVVPPKKKRARPKKARARPASLDDALAKLENLDGRPSPTEPPAGMTAESGRSDPAPQGAAPPAGSGPSGLESLCARGNTRACIEAAVRAERSADPQGGIKARQLLAVACKAGSGQGCWRLSRLMERGVGGARSPSQAKALRAKACTLGHQESCKTGTSSNAAR